MSVYKDSIISTIVDLDGQGDGTRVYKDSIISTIVDPRPAIAFSVPVYKDSIISTIVDGKASRKHSLSL